MTTHVEKFTIEVKDEGMIVKGGEGQHLFFTPIEALMLLDILKAEEVRLKNLADKASPLPFKIKI
ncbi:MAG TPA: hypothetical protein VJ624_01045 [Thermodesulfobacteriota bacterium]|nr:hypothetical protein [Thermodesulfobacteriota bacterium]